MQALSNQTVKMSVVQKFNIAREPATDKRFRASPRSIAPAGLVLARLARLSSSQFSVPQVVAMAMRAVERESSIRHELDLVVGRIAERQHIVVVSVVELPAWAVQGVVCWWRDCVFAVWAEPRLVAAGGAGSGCDVVGNCCAVEEEEVGMDAIGRGRGKSALGGQKTICSMLHACALQVFLFIPGIEERAEQSTGEARRQLAETYKSNINGIVL
jgi:hypothetical protein